MGWYCGAIMLTIRADNPWTLILAAAWLGMGAWQECSKR